ncbi:MAG TPA: hypothetical protein VMQ73_00035 [Methylomirabilota bacterium]|nr:hypothetical protein [Methylomirabilota bacterium]
MADDSRDLPAASAPREELIAAYKRLLQTYLDRRPSGLRLKIAKAIGKHRSFVSQIANPAYSVPIPSRHVETIFKICHFSPEERRTFLAAYAAAHPNQPAEARRPARRTAGRRTIEIELPASGDAVFDAAVEDLIRRFVKDLYRLPRGG